MGMNRKGKRHSTLGRLLRELDNSDSKTWKTSQEEIAGYGKSAIPDLIRLLEEGSQSARRAGATLIGKIGNAEEPEVSALERSLFSDDAKLRKNSAMALGRLKATRSLGILKRAIETETMDWVKPSIILAMGAIGGGKSREALEKIVPNTNAQREAIRKALGRAGSSVPDAKWVDGRKIKGLWAEVPIGLETIAIQESRRNGFHAKTAWPGLINWPKEILPKDVFPKLRCIHNLLIPVAETTAPLPSPMTDWPDEMIVGKLIALLEKADFFERWGSWIDVNDDMMNFRFFVSESKVPPRMIKKLSRKSRDILGKWRWFDNPYAYSVELGLKVVKDNIVLVLRPSFMKDKRFMYRKRDVGASINPVVASCLAWMAGPACGGLITDPTCGSGTLLIERALLDNRARLLGIDISPRAIGAAKLNIESAGLTNRTQLLRGDAANINVWDKTHIVLANLPFGVRARAESTSLSRLYSDLLRNADKSLADYGKIVLYSSRKRALESAIRDPGVNLKTVQSYETTSDGIKIYISVMMHPWRNPSNHHHNIGF